MSRRIAGIMIMGVLMCAAPVSGQAQEAVLRADMLSAREWGEAQEISFYERNNFEVLRAAIQKSVESKSVTLYTTANVNFREHPDTESAVIKVLPFNTKFRGYRFDDEWYVGEFDGNRGFIHGDYVSEKRVKSSRHSAPKNTIKSFMSYRTITLKSSPQYHLQKEYAYTGDYGIRQIKGRFCAALGSAYTTKVGQYFDLILKNGTCIPCILADQKANRDTDSAHKITYDGSLAEFIVDTGAIGKRIWRSGDIGSACPEWDSPVKIVRIYEKNLFE